MIVDAAAYLPPDLLLTNVNATKATALVTLPAVMSCTGAGMIQRLLAEEIERRWPSFDALISDGSEWLAEQFTELAEMHLDGNAQSQLFMIGWHKAADRPGAYSIDLWTDGPAHREWLTNSAAIPGFDPDALTMQFENIAKNITGSPMPDVTRMAERCFEIRAPDDYKPDLELLHILEAARRTSFDGKYGVGGKAVLSSIDEHGIQQRVLHHWAEDEVGKTINPLPIDWQAWRAARTPAVPDGMSRLRRQMLDRKNRKAAR